MNEGKRYRIYFILAVIALIAGIVFMTPYISFTQEHTILERGESYNAMDSYYLSSKNCRKEGRNLLSLKG